MPVDQITRWTTDGATQTLIPTTLDKIGKQEKFLEDILAASPGLMGLESRRSGIRQPFAIFQQLDFPTPSGRTISPDITMLSASGHVVVVEVKRYVNPELRDRSVIAQIIDYASSFSALSETGVLNCFRKTIAAESWFGLVEQVFPNEPNCDELADILMGRLQGGELNLVIACDRIPPGLPEMVEGIVTQATLGFELDVVEVTPYVREVSGDSEIIFVPTPRVATEIVARTAVTVTYRKGDAQPSTSVETTPLNEIEENVRATSKGRLWTPEEVEAAFADSGESTALAFLHFAKEHGAGDAVAPGYKKRPAFNFYCQSAERRSPIVNCTLGSQSVNVWLGEVDRNASSEVADEFRRRFSDMFPDRVRPDAKDVAIRLETLAPKLPKFQELLLWLKEKLRLA